MRPDPRKIDLPWSGSWRRSSNPCGNRVRLWRSIRCKNYWMRCILLGISAFFIGTVLISIEQARANCATRQHDRPVEPGDLAGTLWQMCTAYQEAVQNLNQSVALRARERYAEMSIEELVTEHDVGPWRLDSIAEMIGFPIIGQRVSAQGVLAYAEPEEMSAVAAPRSYRLYELYSSRGTSAYRSIALDVSSLEPDLLVIVDRYCNGAITCEVSVSGRVDEVLAHRGQQYFTESSVVDVTIGIVVERIDFRI